MVKVGFSCFDPSVYLAGDFCGYHFVCFGILNEDPEPKLAVLNDAGCSFEIDGH